MSGGRTPAWGAADGGRTVNPYTDGSRTVYGGGMSGGVSACANLLERSLANCIRYSERRHGIRLGQGITIHSVEAELLRMTCRERPPTAKRQGDRGTATTGHRRTEETATTALMMLLLQERISTLRLHRTEVTHQHQRQQLLRPSCLATPRMRQRPTVVNQRRLQQTVGHGMMTI